MRKPVSNRRQKKEENKLSSIELKNSQKLDSSEDSKVVDGELLEQIQMQQQSCNVTHKTILEKLDETGVLLNQLKQSVQTIEENLVKKDSTNFDLKIKLDECMLLVEKASQNHFKLEEIGEKVHQQNKYITTNTEEIKKSILGLTTKLISLEDIPEKIQISINQIRLELKDKFSKLDEILTEIKLSRNSHVSDYKTLLSFLLNKKQDVDTERTISFQLGKTLIDSKKSVEGLIGLPNKLVTLFEDAKSRKDQKKLNTELDDNKKVVETLVLNQPIEKKVDTDIKIEVVKKDINKENPQISYDYIKNLWPKNTKKARFISILDEISENSWTNEFTLYPLNKNQYESQINGSSSNAIFIESCWKGNNGSWEYAFTSPGLKHGNAQKLLHSLDIAKQKNMPIIFWNKEDPMHYEKFLPIAEKCDIIFTTDENKVSDYKRDLVGKKVFAMEFAANPYICNPINRSRYEQESICFAGSYYSVGHDDRKVQMDQLLPALLEFDGAIYDRMSALNNERYFFPTQYRHLIRDAVDFKTMSVLYKKFKIFLNVNTITDSPTMMSRRVYELLACGTPVISTPSLALETQFPDIVQVASNATEAIKIAKELLGDEWKYRHLSHRGYREVMLKHTYAHRVKNILSSIDISYEQPQSKVSILMATMREHFIDRIITNIKRQNYSNIELIIVTQNFTKKGIEKLNLELSSLENLSKYTILEINDEMSLGARLNAAAEKATGDYFAKMDDDDFYFENYLTDMILPFSYGNFGLVGKKEMFIYLEESNKTVLRYKDQSHRVTDFVTGATLTFSREAFLKVGGFNDVNRGEDSTIIDKLKAEKIAIYSSDPFNFIVWRGKDSNSHTWKVEDEFFSKNAVVFDGFINDKVVV